MCPVFDIHVYFVDPVTGAGSIPHRDCDGLGNFTSTFRSDLTPKHGTVWVALTDALPENSCIYCLPAYEDVFYWSTKESEVAPTPCSEAQQLTHDALLANEKNAHTAVRTAGLQAIRAMPARAGDVLAWSHRLLHWGGLSSRHAQVPRIALSYAVADPLSGQSRLVR